MSEHDAVIKTAIDWLQRDGDVALATVTATWGSSPRPVGSLLVVARNGAFEGSVSGGCIEGAVVREALDVIADGRPRTLEFGVSDEQAWEVGLACGGNIRIAIRRFTDKAWMDSLLHLRPVAAVSLLHQDEYCLVFPDAIVGELRLGEAEISNVRRALADDKSTLVETDRGQAFAQVVNPPLRMIVVGAVHVAQALVPLASVVGYEVIVVDPRRAFATEARMPQVRLCQEWPDEAITKLAPDARTAIVTLTHDPKLDDPAIEAALNSPAYYIGALGSRRTHAKRLDRLRERGFAEDRLRRIRGPVGLDIGAESAAEIALSIVAEVVAVRRRRTQPD